MSDRGHGVQAGRLHHNSGAAAPAAIALYLLTLAGGPGCTRTPIEAPEFFPLHPDDTWVYDIVKIPGAMRSRMKVRVRGSEFVEPLRKRCNVVEERYAAGRDQPLGEAYPVAYYREDGFVHRALSLEFRGDAIVELGLRAAEERFLPVVLTERSVWDGATTAYDRPEGNGYAVDQTHRAVREAGLVEVPAGRFPDCIRVDTVAVQGARRDGRLAGPPVTYYYADWYAPNVGLVRSRLSNRIDQSDSLAETSLVAFAVRQ